MICLYRSSILPKALLLTLMVAIAAVAAGRGPQDLKQIYVSQSGNDGNDGSVSRPFHTISHASRFARPGTAIHVAPGTYNESIETFASGTEGARVTYVSDERWAAKIVAAPAAKSPYAWKQWGAYVDIIGFEITGNVAYGIWSRGAHDRIAGNHVHHVQDGRCVAGGGIMTGNWTTAFDTEVSGNFVHDVGPAPGTCNKSHGIYVGQASNRVFNNIVYNSAGWGINSWHAATDLVIANNLLFANGGGNDRGGYSGGGINIGAGDEPGGVVNRNSLVANNIVVWNGGAGIREYGAVGQNNRYLNNLVYKNRKDVELKFGIPAETIVADPQFVDFKIDGSGNYHLLQGSPAVAHGAREGAPAADFDGNARPADKNPDIGPFQLSQLDQTVRRRTPLRTEPRNPH